MAQHMQQAGDQKNTHLILDDQLQKQKDDGGKHQYQIRYQTESESTQ